MTAPSLTYTLTNGSTADASQVMQNFNDLLNGITDGTKDLSISALTVAGTATLNGAINLGNATADDITITGSLASTIPIKTTNTYNIGSATLGLAGIYFGTGDTDTARVVSASLAASATYTIPDAGTTANFVMTAGTSTISGAKTFTVGQLIDGSADEVQLRVQGNATQTGNVLTVENSSASLLLGVTNTSGTNIRGTTTNDSAATGFVGEYLENTRLNTSPLNLSTGAANNAVATGLALSAGDWMVGGAADFITAATTQCTEMDISISLTSSALAAANTIAAANSSGEMRMETHYPVATVLGGSDNTLIVPTHRILLSTAATFYLTVRAAFTTASCAVGGSIWARRYR